MLVDNTHYGYEKICTMLEGVGSVFFIGIGGINMSSLALLTKLQGYEVGGSDIAESAMTRRVENAGIKVFYSHDANNLDGYKAVVFTVAIRDDNPEYLHAKEAGMPLISRADYLGYLMMKSRNRIGVSGMHGKSTVTAMLAKIYIDARRDPTVMCGAETDFMDGAYRIGEGKGKDRDFIFEACEYMDSFLDFNPKTALILNIEPEHLDYFGNLEKIKESFSKFAGICGSGGKLIINGDDANAREVAAKFPGKVITFGFSERNDFYCTNIHIEGIFPVFEICNCRHPLGECRLSVTGKHNVKNALAAFACAYSDGISVEKIIESLENFAGAKRRMEYKGRNAQGVRVFDDYAHHPTEIRASLSGARTVAGKGKLVCVFQPHTFSRLSAFWNDYLTAFDDADSVVLCDIYAARETDDLGVSSEKLAREIGGRAVFGGSFENAAKAALSLCGRGDTLVVMGAGDIWKVYDFLEMKK